MKRIIARQPANQSILENATDRGGLKKLWKRSGMRAEMGHYAPLTGQGRIPTWFLS
jgi:hypothetical protein